MTPLEIVVLIGLPGAGKTTFYRRYFAATHRHVSNDLWPNARGRQSRLRREIVESLIAGQPVVVDNVNPGKADRRQVIELGRAHGARVVGYFFDVSTRESIARNAEREGRAKVPNVAIFTMAKRLERPEVSEGFDQLFRVSLTAERTFSITEIG
jgi:predicted kinase